MPQAAQTIQDREFTLSDREFKFFTQLVSQQTGIVLAPHKRDMVYSRLVRRLRALKLKSFADYCALLESNAGEAEMGNFINAVTTNLTSFFRESHHFDHLRDEVLKPMAAQGEKRVRIWSSACSSGMEPYSIAMTLDGVIGGRGWDAKILATDIDTNMLTTGEQGLYAGSEYENIPPAYRKKVQRHAQQIEMADEWKSLIAFKHLNLLQGWPMKGPFDAVFCRNVVIYFDKPTQKKLFARMAEMIKPGGWLYIGHSENLMNISDQFTLSGRTIYRRNA